MKKISELIKKIIYWGSLVIIKIVLSIPFLFWIKKKGFENIPKSGATILAFSHKSWLDIPVSSLLIWRTWRYHRYIAKESLFHKFFLLSWWLDCVEAIPVDRDNPKPSAIKLTLNSAVVALKKGEVVVVFPEGTRVKGDQLGGFNEGVAAIALLAKRQNIVSVILPVLITYQKGRIFGLPLIVTVNCGEPIASEEFSDRKALTAEIKNRMQNLHS